MFSIQHKYIKKGFICPTIKSFLFTLSEQFSNAGLWILVCLLEKSDLWRFCPQRMEVTAESDGRFILTEKWAALCLVAKCQIRFVIVPSCLSHDCCKLRGWSPSLYTVARGWLETNFMLCSIAYGSVSYL